MGKTCSAVAFDFDGVVLESMEVKTRAFEALFAPEGPQAVSAILALHQAHGGISRFEKFRYAYREILKRPLGPEEEKTLGERFNALVEEAVAASEWVPGAREFLEAYHERLPLFVASGTPQEELRRIVEKRGLTPFFRGIYGTPATKEEILINITAAVGCPPAVILMLGDATSDYEGALRAGTRFIGRVRPGEKSPFPPGTRTLPDLRDLARELGL